MKRVHRLRETDQSPTPEILYLVAAAFSRGEGRQKFGGCMGTRGGHLPGRDPDRHLPHSPVCWDRRFVQANNAMMPGR